MSQDVQVLGQMFTERRKELNVSLKEVESATSIRVAHLEAIEGGQIEKLISPVYAQGFVRQYAAFLGLDGDKIITEYPEVFKKPISQDFAYGIGTLETRGHPGSTVKGVPQIVWVIGFAAVLGAAYLVAKSLELF